MKNTSLLKGLIVALGLVIVGGVVALIQIGNFNDQSRASSGLVMVGKLVRATDNVCTKCVQQCPGKDNVLRSCTPMESDGTSLDSTCDRAGRVEICGSKTYCCPKPGSPWTTDMNKCKSVERSPQAKNSGVVANGERTPILMPTTIPSDYRILRDAGSCTALVVGKGIAEPLVGKKVIAIGSLKEPYFYVTKISENKCVEQCPGKDNVLRSCTPPEADGTSEDSTCDSDGRIASCGGAQYCCVSGKWIKDMKLCPKVTATPTSKPSVTPTASPSATPTITPSTSNLPPQIVTTSLPVAFIGQSYSAQITAKDPNTSDMLSMSIGRLPSGLAQGPCAVPASGGSIICYISGVPKETGAFQVSVAVKDQLGAASTGYLPLSVK